jgi:tryptophan synthase beta chain
MEALRFDLSARDLPRHWYNLAADLRELPPPPLHPGTGQPIGPADLAPLFPMKLIEQEVSREAEIAIPQPVLDILARFRPTPLFRAKRLEEALQTPAHIYYKYEGVSPAGSHKPNTAIAQAYYNKMEGVKRLATETGAGQWGSALAYACMAFGLECKVYMVRASFEQKPYRKALIETFGASVVASPSADTHAGRAILERDPQSSGSLGIAISEAVEDAALREDTKYSLGSVLNHVLLHQTIIGLEAQQQMALAGESPDVIIGCVGGGSNFGGIAFPFLRDHLHGSAVEFVAVEPASCPTLSRGEYRYDFGDTAQLTPLMPMYTLGHQFMPSAIHAGGLRYHGAAPLLSFLVHSGLVRAEAYGQRDVFESALLFARTEGLVPAPESAHAIKAAIVNAQRAKAEGKARTILFNLSGHGYFDMSAYTQYLAGNLSDQSLSDADLAASLSKLDGLPAKIKAA